MEVGTNLKQIDIDVVVLPDHGGTGNIFRTVMGHDTGSTSLSIFDDEIHLLLNPAGILNLRQTRTPVVTAAGIVIFFSCRSL